MTYSITIYGKPISSSPEENRALEEKLIRKLRALMPDFEGVGGAYFTGTETGVTDLLTVPEKPTLQIISPEGIDSGESVGGF